MVQASLRIIPLAAAAALFIHPTASAAQTATAPLQCRTLKLPVKQFSTDATTQSVWTQLCYGGQVSSDTPVQVLIHGGAYNHTYWDSPFQPDRYSYVRAATRLGYVTLNFDRLGYGQSDRPPAATLDFNVAGYVTHQIVQALRGGTYGTRFIRVILNGHSFGALTAEEEAANYHDINALIISGIGHDFLVTPNLTTIFVPASTDPKFIDPGAYDPAIVPFEEGVEKDTLSPTELGTLGPDLSDTSGLTQRINVPVFFAQGRYDQLWCNRSNDCTTDPQANKEASYWSPGVSFTRFIVPDAGHSINSNLNAPVFYGATFAWLAQKGFAPH